MLVALVFGREQGQKLGDNIKKNKNNIEIDSFDSFNELVTVSNIRHRYYDRIVLLGNKCDDNVLSSLGDYWEITPNTDIILFGKKKTHEDICKTFLTVYKSPKFATVLVDAVTLNILLETVTLPTVQLQQSYGLVIKEEATLAQGLDIGFSFDDNDLEEVKPETNHFEEVPVNTVENKPQEIQKQEESKAETPKHKKTILGAIFGTNKKKEQPQKQVQNTPNNSVPNTAQVQSNVAPVQTQEVSQVQSKVVQEQLGMDLQNFNMPNIDIPNIDLSNVDMSNINFDQPTMPDLSDIQQVQQTPVIDETQEEVVQEPVQEDFSFDGFSSDETPQNEMSGSNEQDTIDLGFNFDFSSMEQSKQETKQTEKSVTEGVVDVGSFDGMFSQNAPQQPQTKPVQETQQEVSVDFNGFNTAQAEHTYNKQKEQPRVITRTVVKPINIGLDGSVSVVNNLKAGKLHKILLVTGDRGSGVTTTALTVAKYFSKYTSVLYLDCDILNHGVINYLDYQKLHDYEQRQLSGTHSCRAVRDFTSCAIPYDDNFDLLTSDFSVDVSREELGCVQQVVAGMYTNYGLTVVDCPMAFLPVIKDILLISNNIFCVEVSQRGVMNFLCQSAAIQLEPRFSRTIVSRGTIFETKQSARVKSNELFDYYKKIFIPDTNDANWLEMDRYAFNGKPDDKVLNKVLER